MSAPPSLPPAARRPSKLKLFFWLLLMPAALIALYFAIVLNWNYSDGERAGWVQKFSRKGWLCKTWEGEMAMVTMPGAIPEKFLFTVWDSQVAASINKVMGKRVTLHYQEKVGLPTSCFGETRHFVTGVLQVEEIPLGPGVVLPTPRPAPDASMPGTTPEPAPAPTPAPTLAPAPAPAPAPTTAPTTPAPTPSAPPAPPATPPLQGY